MCSAEIPIRPGEVNYTWLISLLVKYHVRRSAAI